MFILFIHGPKGLNVRKIRDSALKHQFPASRRHRSSTWTRFGSPPSRNNPHVHAVEARVIRARPSAFCSNESNHLVKHPHSAKSPLFYSAQRCILTPIEVSYGSDMLPPRGFYAKLRFRLRLSLPVLCPSRPGSNAHRKFIRQCR